MRIALPVVLLLVGASSAHGQAQTPGPPVESSVPAPAPVQSPPVAAPAPATLPAQPAAPHASARTAAATAVEEGEAQEPKRRNRMLWFLLGAVVVLAIVVAAS